MRCYEFISTWIRTVPGFHKRWRIAKVECVPLKSHFSKVQKVISRNVEPTVNQGNLKTLAQWNRRSILSNPHPILSIGCLFFFLEKIQQKNERTCQEPGWWDNSFFAIAQDRNVELAKTYNLIRGPSESTRVMIECLKNVPSGLQVRTG